MHRRFLSLLLKLSHIESAIDAEKTRPQADWARLFRLKRLRVRIKDHLKSLVAPLQTAALQPQFARITVKNGGR